MTDCICGNPEGTNKECERCRLIAECIRLTELMQCVGACAIERTSDGKYHCVQIDLALWDEIVGHKCSDDDFDDEGNYIDDEYYVSPEDQKRESTWCNICFDFVCTCQATQQKRNDAMERGDYERDRAKDKKRCQ